MTGTRSRSLAGAWVGLVVLLAGAAPAGQPVAYRVGPGDVLEVAVFGQPDLSGRFAVAPDGTFQFPLLGLVTASGLEPRQVEDELRKRLADGYLKSPHVTVTVAEYRSQRVFVVGEVQTPGAIPLTGGLSLLEALARAGSVTTSAGTEVVLVRRGEGTPDEAGPTLPDQPGAGEISRFALADLQAGRVTANPILRHGDTLFVPKAEKIFVLGQVRTPGAYAYSSGMTVLQAISLAGGLTEMASSGRVKVVRVVNGEKKDLKVKVTDAIAPGDTIMVPTRWF